MFSETKWLERPSAELAYHHQPAEAPERAIVLILHGLCEHSRRYGEFALFLAERGYHVYAHDHRGHGESRAPDAPLGRFARKHGVETVIADVEAMRDHAVSLHPGLPVILFGHSMGGLIAFNCAVTHPQKFDLVAVFNSNLRLGSSGRLAQAILLAERALKGSDVPSILLPKLTFTSWGRSIEGHRTDFDWLSRDPVEVDRYIADPLCGFEASVSLWLDVFSMSYCALQPDRLNKLPLSKPIYLVGGGKDPATGGATAVSSLGNHLTKSGFKDVTVQIYRDMRHETLNEYDRDLAMQDFAQWCDARIASRFGRQQ